MRDQDLMDAWAIVRPEPGKARMMTLLLLQDGAEVYAPTLLMPRGNGALVPVALYHGYAFVRPRLGRREALFDALYVLDVLKGVLFDRLVEAIRAYCAEHDLVKREEKALFLKASEPRLLKSFAELAGSAVIEAIDSKNLAALFKAIERDSLSWAGRIEDYLRTDDLADRANISAVAMVKGHLRFQ